MPHIKLVTSSDLAENGSTQEIVDALVATLSSVETVDPKAVKASHVLRSVWAMGEGGAPGFAHCEVAILKGRSPEVKKAMADKMFECMKEQFQGSSDSNDVSLTLEIREMEAETYRK